MKVSVGGSLSADVSCDIPVRIVNFVSLDPPPGHMGASPLPEQSSRPLNRSWSTNLKNGRIDSLRAKAQGRSGPIARMASVDSFHLSDLNGGRGPSRMGAPALSRIASMSSLRTDDFERERGGGGGSQAGTSMSRATTAPLSQLSPAPARGQGVVDRAKDRQLQHQMSLQCISTAIASATARRTGLSPISQASEMGDDLRAQQQLPWDEGAQQYYGGGGQEIYDDNGSLLQLEVYPTDGLGIQLDDLDEVPDGDSPYLDEENDRQSPEDLAYLGESDDELDTFMQSRFSEDEGDDFDVQPVSRSAKPPASPRWSERPGLAAEPVVTRSPAVRSRASSPIKAPLSIDVIPSPRSAMRRPSETFAFATPNSPVKAHVDLPPVSPLHFDNAGRDNESMPPPSRNARPLPHRPSPTPGSASPSKSSTRNQPVELTKQPSTSSLKRSSNVIRKTPSTRSLRQTASDAQLPELDFGEPSASDSETVPTPIATSRTSPALSSRSSSSRTSRTSTMPPPTSPRKVVVARSSASAASSPVSLRSTRSISDFRSATAPLPPPTRKSSVLPSVKNKISALETREATLSKLAHTSGRAKVNTSQLDRSDSVSSQITNATSEASFKLSDLTRGNSMASFKAPLLRRNFSDMPPLPTTRF